MKIAVCVKQIPDPNQPYALEGARMAREGVPAVLDPGDEYGVEAGLRLVEQLGGEVTVVSMGPPRALEAVHRALSMGAHRAILVSDERLAGADALVTARVLAAAIRRVDPDLVLAGVESTDGSSGVVPSMVAELLGIPQATFAIRLEVQDGLVVVQRQTEAGYDVVECSLPALVTVTAAVGDPRYPSFKGIMQAKKRPFEQFGVSDLGLAAEDVSATQWVCEVTPAPARGAGVVIEDDGTAAARIADFLEQHKV
ncbi:MAG: electron transfer flavoprotein subunit beta/FixA family protein, partial [Actinomycetota bacterium]